MRTRLLFGCSHSAGGTIQAAVEGGFGAGYNTSMLVDRAIVRLFELRGLLKELPDAN